MPESGDTRQPSPDSDNIVPDSSQSGRILDHLVENLVGFGHFGRISGQSGRISCKSGRDPAVLCRIPAKIAGICMYQI
jgi:hypothetical protein